MVSVPHARRQTDGKGVDEKLLVTGRVDSSFVLAYIDERLEEHSVVVASLNTRSKNKRYRRFKGPTLYRMMPIENVMSWDLLRRG
jgi:hypothetical protein